MCSSVALSIHAAPVVVAIDPGYSIARSIELGDKCRRVLRGRGVVKMKIRCGDGWMWNVEIKDTGPGFPT